MPVYLTINAAHQAERAGQPWHIRLVNTTNRSAFWEAWGKGDGRAYINWGKLGTSGRSSPMSKSAWQAFDTAREKTNKKGYYNDPTSLSKPPARRKKVLPPPFDKVRKIEMSKTDTHGVAYDASGNRMMKLPKATVQQLIADADGAIKLVLLQNFSTNF